MERVSFDKIIELADQGNIDAMVVAIQQFVWNEGAYIADDPKIAAKVVEYLTRALEAGNVEAMNQLAAMYQEGRIVEPDLKRAFLCYKMASEAGDALATSNLGFMYYYGKGTRKNYNKAFQCFVKASSWDIGDSIIKLGDMYREGQVASQDIKTAIMLYEKAYRLAARDLDDWGMQQVFSDTCLRLGEVFYNGEGVEQDLIKAARYYSHAWYYYVVRENKGDSYSEEGYKKSKKMMAHLVKFL